MRRLLAVSDAAEEPPINFTYLAQIWGGDGARTYALGFGALSI